MIRTNLSFSGCFPGTMETPRALCSAAHGYSGTQPYAIVRAVPEFTWGMSSKWGKVMNGRAGSETKLIFPALAGFYASVSDLAYPMVRIVVGSIIFIHGWNKFNGNMAGIASSMAKMGLEPSGVFAYSAVFLETIRAICIIVGLVTRFFAAALAIEMFIAFIVVHMPKGFSVSGGGYEYVLLLGILLFAIALRGGARYSVDRLIGKEL